MNADDLGEASEIVADAEKLPQQVLDLVTSSVLEKAADQLELAAAEYESRAEPLLKQLEENPYLSEGLGTAADELESAAQPWCELIGVFDDDPYSGREGHALDHVAGLLRGTSISIANHAGDYGTSERLLDLARDIAQSASSKSSYDEDLRQVRYIRALGEAMTALRVGDTGRAATHLTAVQSFASTEEEHAQAAQLSALIRLRASGARQPQLAASSSSGCGTIIGVIVGLLVVGGIVAAIIGSALDSSTTSSGNDSSSRDAAPPAGDSDSSREAERLAMERERSRLENVESELSDLGAEIDALARRLEATQAQYPNGAPGYVVDQYEADRLRHNRLIDEYEAKFSEYEADADALDRRVDAYNRR